MQTGLVTLSAGGRSDWTGLVRVSPGGGVIGRISLEATWIGQNFIASGWDWPEFLQEQVGLFEAFWGVYSIG